MTGRTMRYFKLGMYYLVVLLVSVPILFVFYWMVAMSLKYRGDTLAYPPLFVFRPTLDNYQTVFRQTPFLRYLLNSVTVAAGATALGLLLGMPAAYAVARYKRSGLVLPVLVARMAPGMAYLVPWFIVLRLLGMVDTLLGLTLAHLILTLPVILWLMIGFFEDLPPEIEESALIDGCTWFDVFWRIAIPVTRPGIVASCILAFIESWNHLSFAMVLTNEKARTLPVAAFHFIAATQVNWGALAATGTLILLPVFVLTLLVQRHIVSGLTTGAVK